MEIKKQKMRVHATCEIHMKKNIIKRFFFFFKILNILTHTERWERDLKKLTSMHIHKDLIKRLIESWSYCLM